MAVANNQFDDPTATVDHPLSHHSHRTSPAGSTTGTTSHPSGSGNSNTNNTGLIVVPHNDEEFAALLRERTKQRKEREDAALAELRVHVRRLEAALTAETKRRVAAVSELQTQAKHAVDTVLVQWKESLGRESAETQERLNVLEQRLVALEERWERDVKALDGTIANKAKAWKTSLEELQSQAETERKARLQREGKILQRIQELSEQYQEQWKEERHARVAELSALTGRVHIQEDARDAQVKKLEERIHVALEGLNVALRQESTERQERDDEIVDALNKYTAQVQTSLSFVSGV